MNETLGIIHDRKSIRQFLRKPIPDKVKADIIAATLRSRQSHPQAVEKRVTRLSAPTPSLDLSSLPSYNLYINQLRRQI